MRIRKPISETLRLFREKNEIANLDGESASKK